MSRRTLWTFALFVLLAFPTFQRAATLIPPRDLGELAARSEAVVLATAGPSHVFHRGPLLFTLSFFSVEQSVSGPLREDFAFEVEVPGGSEGDSGWMVAGAPRFEPGRSYLLFLVLGREGRWKPVALSYGLLKLETGRSGVDLLVPLPESSEAGVARRPDGESAEPVGIYVEQALLVLLRNVIAGFAPWDSKAVLAPAADRPPAPLTPPSECAFMNDGSYNMRWNIFDSGSGSLDMHADSKGDNSLSGGGFSQVQGAVSGWMGVPDTSLRLSYGGPMNITLTCTSGTDAPPSGKHIVVSNDPCSDMADLVGCTGALAFGGPYYNGTHTFDGATWSTCQSWFVVVNNGSGCIGATNYQLMIEHELGHGLGFGHVSDPNALMYAYCCNNMDSTDITCAQYLYPPGGSMLSVSLSPSPASGVLPLPVTLSANVSGSVTGPINYAFWWNCNDPGTSIGSVSSSCGNLPSPSSGACAGNANGYRCNQVNTDPQTCTNTYTFAGTYKGKVIVERGSAAPAESRTTITVTGTPPVAPTNLLATALSSSQISLSWTDNSGDELGFKVERKWGTPGAWSQVGLLAANKTTYQDAGLTPTTLYTYRVRAYGPGGDSAYTNEASATTQSSTFIAVASASPAAGAAPLAVQFTGEGQGGQSPYAYDWDFKDGSTHSTEQNPSHTYTVSGIYEWLLTVRDASSKSTTAVGTVEVGAPLAAVISAAPLSGDAPLSVRFDGSASGGSTPYSLLWNFGDGSAPSTQASVLHSYADPGLYTATLSVMDGAGQSASSNVTIHATTGIPPPAIGLVKALTNPFRLSISGLNFHSGCTVKIDGQSVPQTIWKNSALLLAKGGAALKAMAPKGTTVSITVTNNDDGGVSGPYPFSR